MPEPLRILLIPRLDLWHASGPRGLSGRGPTPEHAPGDLIASGGVIATGVEVVLPEGVCEPIGAGHRADTAAATASGGGRR